MKTSVKLLPAINSLYELGLTNKEIQNLVSSWIIQRDLKAATGEEPLSFKDKIENKLYSRLFLLIRKNNDIITSVCPDDLTYEKENCIFLRRLPEDSQLVDSIKENTIYYGYAYDRISSGRFSQLKDGEILFESLKKEDLSTLSTVDTLLNLFRNNAKEVCPSVRCDEVKVYKNPKAVTKIVKKELLENYEYVNKKFDGTSYHSISVSNLRTVLSDLYPDSVSSQQSFTKSIRRSLVDNSRLRYMHSVIEVDNYRFSVSIYASSSYGDDLSAQLKLVPHTHEHYNYVDAGRLWYGKDSYYSEQPHVFGKAMFIQDEPPLPKSHVLDDYLKRVDNEVKLLTNNDLNLITKRFLQKEHRLNAERMQREALDKKISDKLNTLKTDKGSLKINDVMYTKDNISYQGQTLKATDSYPDWVHGLLRRQTRGMDYQRITFDNIFDSFVSLVRRDKDHSPLINRGIVGDVEFDITEQSSTNVNNITSKRYYINGSRVNTNEIHHCIERAICYDNQADYDHFLKSVSSCSIKMHRYLQLGIDIRVRDQFDHTQVVLKFPIERFKNLNYLVINDTEYKIRDTQKLLRLEKADDLMQVINVLLSGDVVMGVEPEDIKGIIDSGKQAYVDAIAKSKELLEHAENTLGVSEQHIEMKDGTSFNGYLVEGQLRTYAVNAHDARHSVYDYDTAQYICIVDKSNTAQVGKDMLVNRLFALHNDSVVATKINTLNKRSNANG